jgi:hypothetical protein
VERVTGQARARDVPIEIDLVMSDATLLEPETPSGDEPAHLDGYGAIPAGLARRLILEAGEATPMWLRRLFNKARTGELAAMDTHRREFTANQRRFVRLRDQYCRTPWCEAPIRHTDHVTATQHGGPTGIGNARGSCEACNYAKEAPGWSAMTTDGEVLLRTPTGHTYRNRAPDAPSRLRRYPRGPERRLAVALGVA